MLCYHPAIVEGTRNMPNKILAALVATLTISISACGMRGSLVMPPGPAPEPVLGNRKSAPPPEPATTRSPVSSTETEAK